KYRANKLILGPTRSSYSHILERMRHRHNFYDKVEGSGLLIPEEFETVEMIMAIIQNDPRLIGFLHRFKKDYNILLRFEEAYPFVQNKEWIRDWMLYYCK